MLRSLPCFLAVIAIFTSTLWAENEKNAEAAAKVVEPAAKFVKIDEKTVGNWKGHVKLHFKRVGGSNAAVSGISFDAPAKTK